MADCGWSFQSISPDGLCDKSKSKLRFCRRSVSWNAERKHLNKLFRLVTLYFDNLICEVGMSSVEFNMYMRLFLAIEVIVDKALVLFCKDGQQRSICIGWNYLPRLDCFNESFTTSDYGNTIAHLAIETGLICLADGYEDFYSAEADNELLDEGELFKMYMLKYLIMNFRFMNPSMLTLDVTQRLDYVFNDAFSNDEQYVALELYVRHIELLLLPNHNLRSRVILFETRLVR